MKKKDHVWLPSLLITTFYLGILFYYVDKIYGCNLCWDVLFFFVSSYKNINNNILDAFGFPLPIKSIVNSPKDNIKVHDIRFFYIARRSTFKLNSWLIRRFHTLASSLALFKETSELQEDNSLPVNVRKLLKIALPLAMRDRTATTYYWVWYDRICHINFSHMLEGYYLIKRKTEITYGDVHSIDLDDGSNLNSMIYH